MVLRPWLMRVTDAAAFCQRDISESQSEAAQFDKTSTPCLDKQGIATAVRTIFAEAPGPVAEAAFD